MPNLNHSDIAIFKALGDETRLRILRLLGLEELNVWELGMILEMPQPTISRHLSILRQSGLVSDRRDGNRVFYRVSELDEPLECFTEYLKTLPQKDHPDLLRLEDCLSRRAAGPRDFAEAKAAEWDALGKNLQQQPAQLYMLAGLNPHELTVADLGTGTGLLLPFLADFASQVYAVDQSPAMLRRARERCSRNQIENVQFIHSQLEKLGDDLPACDSLALHFVLHQIARPGTLLQHLRQFLKPKGRLAIIDRLHHDNQTISEKYGSVWHGFHYEQLQEWLAHAGLTTLKWHTLPGSEINGDTLPLFVLIAQAG